MRVTRVELPGEFSVYKYTLEYVTTYLPGESDKAPRRVLYSIYISLSSYRTF